MDGQHASVLSLSSLLSSLSFAFLLLLSSLMPTDRVSRLFPGKVGLPREKRENIVGRKRDEGEICCEILLSLFPS